MQRQGLLSRKSSKIALLGDYPPRRCGIATFTHDLHMAVQEALPDVTSAVLAVTDPGQRYEYPAEVRFEIQEKDVQSYVRAADFINLTRFDVLCVQHEFGIFGGPAGSHLIALLRRAQVPTVTTLHTILAEPTRDQLRVFGQIVECSSRLVTMTEKGALLLRDVYGVSGEKITVIPHGIPDLPFIDPNFYKDQFAVAGRPVLLTFGLLSPGKGIEYAIRALPEIAKRHPNVVYIILGSTHPNLIREKGETYRLSLERLARELGVENNVMFVNRYVDDRELGEFIGAADIYLTPYLNEAQITSGTLAFCFGCGKAVVSTPYWHAKEMLAEGRGVLVPFRESLPIAEAVIELLDDEPRRHSMRKNAYLMGREMVWSQVGVNYATLFDEVIESYRSVTPSVRAIPAATLDSERADLPAWKFDHLARLTDSTGVFQHAIYTLPWFEHGYCLDDNARALLLTVLIEELEHELPEILKPVQTSAAAFINHAFVGPSGRFRNFLSFDRRWLEDVGSEDSHARALWALGAVIGRTNRPGLRAWAIHLFEQALPAVESFTSPRAWAFTLLGIQEYLRQLHGDLLASRLRHELVGRLEKLLLDNSTPDWIWFEGVVAYDNARLPQALIQVGRWIGQATYLEHGLRALDWLYSTQTAENGFFRPVGSNGFWHRGEAPARFDQQPLEAAAMVGASIDAWHATGEERWKERARKAFDWFLGANDLGLPLYDAQNGGCCDGLQETRINQNQGAESTLSFLLSLAEMRALLGSAASFGPVGTARHQVELSSHQNSELN